MIVKFRLLARRARFFCLTGLFLLVWFAAGFNQARATQSVELSWDPSPDDDVGAYNVYYGTTSGSYDNCVTFSDVTDVIIPGLQDGQTYYFAVSAIDDNDVEGELSSEVSYAVPVPDPIVLQANMADQVQDVELNWVPGANDDYYVYNVYYGTQSGVYTNMVTFYYQTDVVIYDLPFGNNFYFVVTALDAYGDETPFSNEVSYAVPLPVPIVLQTQTYADDNGVPYLMEVTVNAPVNGYWELDTAPDLQSWSPYEYGYGYGYGDGYDVDVYYYLDPTQPQMFFRVINY